MALAHYTSLALYFLIYDATACISSMRKSLHQLNSHELVHFNFDELNTSNIIEFDFEGQHYQVQLEKNDQLSPIINHQTKDELIIHHLPTKKLCHYHGKVLNYVGKSVVALSLCDCTGVRGLINAFGYEIWIYPSEYYLNELSPQNPSKCHSVMDEHLIYKTHNYSGNDERRRLQTPYNNGDNVVEIYTLTDPSFVNHFKNSEGNNWYSTLYDYLSQVINQASAKYEAVNWGSNIGSISLKWVALDVVESFTGNYASLYCQPCSGGHNQRCMSSNPGTCNYQDYLDIFVTWYKANKDLNDFDYGMIFTSNNVFNGNGDVGYSFYSGICNDNIKSGMISAYSYFELPEMHALFAHELGHNLGCENHDSSGCSSSDANNRWIMCSWVGQSTFSTYSIQLIQNGFSNNNGFSCLQRRTNPFETNHNVPTQAPVPTTNSPTQSPNTIPCQNERCYLLTGFSTNIDASYTVTGCHNNKGYYSSNGNYLYWSETNTNWHINSVLDDLNADAYCNQNTLALCSSNNAWFTWNNGWIDTPTADNIICSGNIPTNTPTTIPSNNPTITPTAPTTNSPTQSPNTIPCEHEKCYLLTDFSANIDNSYTVIGCHNSKGYYSSSNGYYLYWSETYTNWHINTELDDFNAWAHCDENTLSLCSSNNGWLLWGNSQWTPAPTADSTQCNTNVPSKMPTDSPVVNLSNNPSKQPTNSPVTNASNNPTIAPTQPPINSIPCGHEICYVIAGFSANIDDSYTFEGCHNGKGYYISSEGYYLYWSETYTNWHINTLFDDLNAVAYCDENTLALCSSNNAWLIWNNGEWVATSTAYNTVCSSNSPSKMPTNSPVMVSSRNPSQSPTDFNNPNQSPRNFSITVLLLSIQCFTFIWMRL